MAAEPNDLRTRVLADASVPEPVRRALERGAPLESIRLDARGSWWHQGRRVEHARIAELFSRSVDRTEGGTYVLRIPPFTYPIVVEDTPYRVTGFGVEGDAIALRLNDGSLERVAPEMVTYEGAGRLLARVREGRLTARFERAAYHALLEHVEEGANGLELVVGARRVPMADRPSKLA